MGLFFDPKPDRTQVWMNGGGTQSCAVAAMILQGKLPKPDYAILVDTGRERSATFEYHERWVRPAIEAIGVRCVIVAKEDYATVDLTSGKHVLIPAFTTQNGGRGKLTNYCSQKWKLHSKRRWLREQGVAACDTWLGISLDEMRRVRKDDKQWDRTIYPLIDLRMRRYDCEVSVLKMGWPKPPRSACWMCPNACDREWKDLRDNRPDDFAKAVAFEQELRILDPHLWLHESCVPLNEVDFDSRSGSGFDKECDSGLCFV